MSYYDYEKTLLGYLENIKAQILARPLNLGGVTGSGGGVGGPPGGFNGYLPQTRVAYDLSEAEDNTIPIISGNLVDNLNHIRYRIKQLEDTTGPGSITIKSNGSIVASGITIVDFINATVNLISGTEVSVTTSGGSGGGSTHSHKYNVTTSGTTHFDIPEVAVSGTLRVYYNGVRQDDTYFVVDGDYQGFTTTFTALAGDEIVVDYDLAVASGSGGGHTIEDEGTPLTQRTKLNFVGAGVVVTDDSANDASVVTITGGSGSGHTIQDEGTPKTQRANLNFVGSSVTVTDDAGNNATVVTITATGSGGGGAPDDAYYVTTRSGTLTNAIVIPGFESSLDRTGRGFTTPSVDFHCNGTDPLTWTNLPDTYDWNGAYPNVLYMKKTTQNVSWGVVDWSPPGGTGTVVGKVMLGGNANSQGVGIAVFNAAQTIGTRITLDQFSTPNVYLRTYSGGVWSAGNNLQQYGQTMYLKLDIDSSAHTIGGYYSENGITWRQVAVITYGIVPAKVGFVCHLGAATYGEYATEFLRAT